MNVILTGPQGSGKGTQAELLVEREGYFHLETGKVLRQMAKTDKRIYDMVVVRGVLVPDKENYEIARDHLIKKHAPLNKIVFDGYPRSVKQYEYMKDWLAEKKENYGKLILIDIPEKVTIERLVSRRTCEKCGKVYNLLTNPPPKENACECGGKLTKRKDDNPKTIKNRLSVYRKQTVPVIKKAQEDGIFVKIDGEKPIEEIYEEIVGILELV